MSQVSKQFFASSVMKSKIFSRHKQQNISMPSLKAIKSLGRMLKLWKKMPGNSIANRLSRWTTDRHKLDNEPTFPSLKMDFSWLTPNSLLMARGGKNRYQSTSRLPQCLPARAIKTMTKAKSCITLWWRQKKGVGRQNMEYELTANPTPRTL